VSALFAVLSMVIAIGCSNSYDPKLKNVETKIVNTNSRLVFAKSSTSNWNQKRVEISFEDAFQQFYPIDNKENELLYELTDNNLQQGITIKVKVIDYAARSEKVNEIMIEPFALSKGRNQFTKGYNANKQYIIY
jgi:DNA-directed RNA polymerase subunit E'/Rpb7